MEKSLFETIERFFIEDDLQRNYFYQNNLPRDMVRCSLKLKSSLILAGLPWFEASFKYLSEDFSLPQELGAHEGKGLEMGQEFHFDLPFNIALNGERIALNLLSHASSIATYTNAFVKKLEGSSIKLLDTRKTTPGLRPLEKYAVRVGGGFNHRLGQTDLWMIKDNHKNFFGGVEKAIDFFESMGSFYNSIEVEIHNLDEMNMAIEKGARHLMLDNFTPADIAKAVEIKKDFPHITLEVSGGISLDTIEQYKIEGIDAISVGRITYAAPPVDISLKYERL